MKMHKQLVMDTKGHSTFEFDPNDDAQVRAAMKRFKYLTKGEGFTAAARTATGEAVVVKSFDPAVKEMLFIPHLVGG